jgi:hypothetical protein
VGSETDTFDKLCPLFVKWMNKKLSFLGNLRVIEVSILDPIKEG